MRRSNRPLALAALALLAACAPMGVGALSVHDVLLYGLGERHVFFYGNAEGSERTVRVNDRTVTLSDAEVTGPLAVKGALSADGRPTLKLDAKALGERFNVAHVPLSDDYAVLTRGGIEGLYVFDGRNWATLSGPLNGDRKVRLAPKARTGLRGVGSLTDAEADALSAYLAQRGPIAVALIAQEAVPDARLDVNPAPREYLRTALAVQTGVPTDVLGVFTPSGNLEFRQVSSGGNSGYAQTATSVRLDTSAAALARTWQIVGANLVPQPSPPAVNFNESRVVTIFLGQKPTGGYGIAVDGVSLDGDTLVVNVNVRQPGAGAITTQAFTSPYVSIAVNNTSFSSVRVVDKATGRVLAQAG